MPAGSWPRCVAPSTITLIAASRPAQNWLMSPAISGEIRPPTTSALVIAAPAGAERTACTARASVRRSSSTLPVSGTGMFAVAAPASACLMISALLPQRR